MKRFLVVIDGEGAFPDFEVIAEGHSLNEVQDWYAAEFGTVPDRVAVIEVTQ
jgi:hypothetical protein